MPNITANIDRAGVIFNALVEGNLRAVPSGTQVKLYHLGDELSDSIAIFRDEGSFLGLIGGYGSMGDFNDAMHNRRQAFAALKAGTTARQLTPGELG